MGITNLLRKKLQQKSQHIVNAMYDVKTTKMLIQELTDDGSFLEPVMCCDFLVHNSTAGHPCMLRRWCLNLR